MSDTDKQWDQLIKHALASTEEPGEELNRTLIARFKEGTQISNDRKQAFASIEQFGDEVNDHFMKPFKENSRMNRSNRKRVSVGMLVVVFTLVMSITAFAATKLINSREVAEHIGDPVLAQAFESSDAIEINQSTAAGDYNFTLHGIVSGTGLSKFSGSAQNINPDRTYAVVSIAKADGSPMPGTSDPEYGKDPFIVSPLIKGQKPWQVNIMSMNGGYSEIVRDGIMYRLIECDGVEMFADRGVYMAIASGTFLNNESFAYNEDTGEISPKAEYKGISVLFDLPLNKAKADPAKAEVYLKNLLEEPSKSDESEPTAIDDPKIAEMVTAMKEIEKKIIDGEVLPESIKEVPLNDEGMLTYKFKDWKEENLPEELFKEGQTGFSDKIHVSMRDGEIQALQYFKDENGVIKGRIVKVK